MHHPTLVRYLPPSGEYALEVDQDNYPWPTLTLWDMSMNSVQWLEWGIFPAPQIDPCTREIFDGVFHSICFRFEASTGQLYGIEIPFNLVMESLQPSVPPVVQLAQSVPGMAFVDIEFWKDAAQRGEKAVSTPIYTYASQEVLHIEFLQGHLTWLALSPDVWLARDSAQQIAGIRCFSPLIDFARLAHLK